MYRYSYITSLKQNIYTYRSIYSYRRDIQLHITCVRGDVILYTVEPLNSGHGEDEHFVHCSEVVPSSEVEMYGQLMGGGKQFVHCREVVLLSECPLSEVLLYT